MSPMSSAATPTPSKPPIWRRWWFIGIIIILVLGGIGSALGGDDDTATSTASTSAPAATSTNAASETSEATVEETTEPATECVEVSDAVASTLAAAMDENAVVDAAAAVKVPDADSYAVAIRVTGGPFEGDTAVFETQTLDTTSITLAVDGFAKEFTGLPDSALTIADEPAAAAVDCLG